MSLPAGVIQLIQCKRVALRAHSKPKTVAREKVSNRGTPLQSLASVRQNPARNYQKTEYNSHKVVCTDSPRGDSREGAVLAGE